MPRTFKAKPGGMNRTASRIFDDWRSTGRMITGVVGNCFGSGPLVSEKQMSKGSDFRRELASLLNQHSCENESNTPDFILAEYLESCLMAFDAAVQRRDDFFDGKPAEYAAIFIKSDGTEYSHPASWREWKMAAEFGESQVAAKDDVTGFRIRRMA